MADILIIDDDEMLCDRLSRHLKYMGHDVTCSLTLEDGVKTAASKTPDVIFLDVNLPDGNSGGWQLLNSSIVRP